MREIAHGACTMAEREAIADCDETFNFCVRTCSGKSYETEDLHRSKGDLKGTRGIVAALSRGGAVGALAQKAVMFMATRAPPRFARYVLTFVSQCVPLRASHLLPSVVHCSLLMALVPVTAVMVASHISLDILQITVRLFDFVRREMYWVKSEASVMAQLHDALWYICKTADWDAGTILVKLYEAEGFPEELRPNDAFLPALLAFASVAQPLVNPTGRLVSTVIPALAEERENVLYELLLSVRAAARASPGAAAPHAAASSAGSSSAQPRARGGRAEVPSPATAAQPRRRGPAARSAPNAAGGGAASPPSPAHISAVNSATNGGVVENSQTTTTVTTIVMVTDGAGAAGAMQAALAAVSNLGKRPREELVVPVGAGAFQDFDKDEEFVFDEADNDQEAEDESSDQQVSKDAEEEEVPEDDEIADL
jgi:hypothetical protein